jgi:hypothetical protein
MLGKPSIASWRSWFKANSLPATFTTRDSMVSKLSELFNTGKISETAIDAGKIAIEEAGNKLVYLYKVDGSPSHITVNLKKLGVTFAAAPRLSQGTSSHPALVYAFETDGFLRMKWTEPQTKWISNLPAKPTSRPEKQVKTILFIINKKTGIVQTRYDKPERDHSHLENGRISKGAYLTFLSGKGGSDLWLQLRGHRASAATG